MKDTLGILASCLVTVSAFATDPWPTERVRLKDGTLVATLQPKWEEALVLFDTKLNAVKTFSVDVLCPGTNMESEVQSSTAGTIWYQNAIAFTDSTGGFLAIRLASQRIILVDLTSRALTNQIPDRLREEIARSTREKALKLLGSYEPFKRQTGAILCGQLRIREAVPQLKSLLSDTDYYTTYYTTNLPLQWFRKYYVRKAAKDALEAMGQKPSGVIIEEPDER